MRLWCDMKCHVEEGKRHWSWPLTSMVSFGVQDVPLMLICCCSHSITMETEAQRLVLQVLDRAGFQPSGFLSPLSLFTWLTATYLGSLCQGGLQLREFSQKPQLITSGFPILSRQAEKSGLETLGTHPPKWLLEVSWTTPWASLVHK